jgi:NADH-quinone oxidoreductase subunit L
MVTAGVYLIARMHPLFELAPSAADVGAVIGCLTLLVAGTIALAVTDLKRVIAYSTMSQIGYMIMAVSAGAYAAGLFHLMTHAFFKALLFMAAGSVIAAMAGQQDLDKMGGFKRAMPFTYGCMVIGGLALAGIPPFSGFFSKDEILLLIGDRGGWYWGLYVAGYVGAFLTGIYTFRMIFRAFWGDPVPEAIELEEGHLHHAEVHTNPATGEVEDTDVGFPGPEHHIAEREGSMKIAMGTLAFLAIAGGLLQVPKVTHVVDAFLEPTFADSKLYERDPSGGLIAFGLLLGIAVGVAGIGVAWLVWVKNPGMSARIRARLRPVHTVLANKWYFDELIDALVVRPSLWFGSFAQQTFERVFVNGLLVGGATGLARVGSSAVRAAQTGFLRYYAAMLVVGMVGLTTWFLFQS